MVELFGPWLFGVGLFTALLMAAFYLGRLAGFLVDQVPLATIGELVLLYLPAMLVKTFAMAVLLAGLLAFGRLSSDSEIVALQAGGASLYRIIAPVMVFSIVIALVTFWFNEQVVPSATVRSKKLTDIVTHSKKIQFSEPVVRTVIKDHKLQMVIAAKTVEPATRILKGVSVIFYDSQEHESYIMFARELVFDEGNPRKTRVQGGFTLTDAGFQNVIHGTEAWPSQLPKLDETFAELTAERQDEFDLLSMKELRASIEMHRAKKDWSVHDMNNAEYGYWNKIAVPFAAFVFGTLGAVLGIRNHRTGTAAGFALAIAIIFGYTALASFMNVFALGGTLPPYVASFSPITLGLVASAYILWRRNG